MNFYENSPVADAIGLFYGVNQAKLPSPLELVMHMKQARMHFRTLACSAIRRIPKRRRSHSTNGFQGSAPL